MIKDDNEIDKKRECVLRRRGSGGLIKKIAPVSIYMVLLARRLKYNKSKCWHCFCRAGLVAEFSQRSVWSDINQDGATQYVED